jgi:uncharacterized membrane protein
MKKLIINLQSIFSGDTVLLVLSILLFLASVANTTQWPLLRPYRFCGICTLFFSLAFGFLSGMEVIKGQRKKRTIVAAILFLAATVICIRSGHFVVLQGS